MIELFLELTEYEVPETKIKTFKEYRGLEVLVDGEWKEEIQTINTEKLNASTTNTYSIKF